MVREIVEVKIVEEEWNYNSCIVDLGIIITLSIFAVTCFIPTILIL
jgi:hypothetical protein